MWLAKNWKDYEIYETGKGQKLERWGDYLLIRPDPQVLWNTPRSPLWKKANAIYHRSQKGGGEWEFFSLPQQWSIEYELPEIFSQNKNTQKITFHLKPFSFKHTGVFPEQALNWDFSFEQILKRRQSAGEVKLLNLFSYTGGATLAAAAAGAKVTHVDASKGIINWAKENASSSGLEHAGIRWLVDDCVKFVERELRRGNSYDAIIMDPPSYGRGPKGEIWKIEDCIYPLLELCAKLLSPNPLFFLISSYTTGLQPGVLSYMLSCTIASRKSGAIVEADEIGIPLKNSPLALPCGASARCRWEA